MRQPLWWVDIIYDLPKKSRKTHNSGFRIPSKDTIQPLPPPGGPAPLALCLTGLPQRTGLGVVLTSAFLAPGHLKTQLSDVPTLSTPRTAACCWQVCCQGWPALKARCSLHSHSLQVRAMGLSSYKTILHGLTGKPRSGRPFPLGSMAMGPWLLGEVLQTTSEPSHHNYH